MSERRHRAVPRRVASRWIVASAAVGTVLAGTAGPAVVAPAAALPAAHPLSGASATWAAGSWVSANGNTMADVAKIVGATNAASAGLTGAGVGIALIDTGVAPVPGLPAAQVVNGPDLSFDSQAANLRYLDTFGHGTHLAGIIVGDDPATGFKGIAPKAKLTSVKVGASGGVVDTTQVIAALNWVVQHKNDDPANPIKVINLAYGTDGSVNPGTDPLVFAVENAYRNGILVVVAAGNNGSTPGRLNNPAMGSYMLTVGSSNTMGTVTLGDDQLSTFDSTSYQQIGILAPGEGIVSLRNPGSAIDVTYPGARVGDNLFRGSGSSQATAVVSAAAALLFQKAPNATPWQIRSWIGRSHKPVNGPNATKAEGLLDLATAITMAQPTSSLSGGYSTGLGPLETARGGIHVVHNDKTLSGTTSIFGSFNNSSWVTAANNKTAWNGGVWMGKRMAGDGWTGTSWASKTWAEASWTGSDWASQAWLDPAWAQHNWTGRYWSGGDWSGRYWSSSTFEAQSFASKNWAAKTWACAGWY